MLDAWPGVEGRLRRVRWRVLRLLRAVVRAVSVEREGLEMALEDGSIVRGRRVNVESMVDGESGSALGVWKREIDGGSRLKKVDV